MNRAGPRTPRGVERTWHSVSALVRVLFLSSSSSSSSLSAPPLPHAHIITWATPPHTDTRLTHAFVRGSPAAGPGHASPGVVVENFLTSSSSEWQRVASRRSPAEEPGFRGGLLSPPGLCVSHREVVRSPSREKSPVLGLYAPRSHPKPSSIMRGWRRRRNFAFVVLALRLWCLATATGKADNSQEGEWSPTQLSLIHCKWCCRCGASGWVKGTCCFKGLEMSLYFIVQQPEMLLFWFSCWKTRPESKDQSIIDKYLDTYMSHYYLKINHQRMSNISIYFEHFFNCCWWKGCCDTLLTWFYRWALIGLPRI